MANFKTYCREIKHARGEFANWSLGTTLELGDYGFVKDAVFNKRGNITKDYDIKIKSKSFSGTSNIKYKSEGAVEINTAPSISHNEIKASFEIKFLKANAIYLDGVIQKVKRMENLGKIAKNLTKYANKGKWNKKYVMISEVSYSKPTIMLMSSDKNTHISFEANIPPEEVMDLLDLKIPFSYKSSKKLTNEHVFKDKLITPLFRGVQFQQSWIEKLIDSEVKPEDLRMKMIKPSSRVSVKNKISVLTPVPV